MAVIFDFDGVIAESETLANEVLADAITALGYPTTLEDALREYCGRRFSDVIDMIEGRLGTPVPADFEQTLFDNTLAALAGELEEVPGAKSFIRSLSGTSYCIASSSHPARLDLCLRRLDLVDAFGPRVFSASEVPKGKPAPDLFLHAAEQLGVSPAQCTAIEDSESGVLAGKAAGMHVIGLVAASHLPPDQSEVLARAGADAVMRSWTEVADFFGAAAGRTAGQAAASSINSG